MKQRIREHIDQLNIQKGGGIISEKIRVGTIDNPMLVIGLGGTGIDALLRLKYMINRRFELPKDSQTKRYAEKPKGIEFVGIETNFADRDKKYPDASGVGLDPNRELIMLSNSDIGPMLRSKELMEDCIKEWISPHLSPANGTNGAGGIRQLGRLMLFSKIGSVIQSIETKIDTLMTGKGDRLYVFILSGISGGTGSGCFLDIAYIIRGIMERKFSYGALGKYEILGYLFTPDVNLTRENVSQFEKDYIMKNGYAGLKELDYWMNIGERKERFIQNYRNVLTVNSEMPPFDLCHLISSHNINKVKLEEAYDYCMNVTAENITNFMANEEKVSGQFAIHDYLSNVETIKSNMVRPFQANYKYSILGAASAVLPIEEITTYLAYKLFNNMNNIFEKAPSQQAVDEFLKQVRADKESISRRFDREIQEPLVGFQQNPQLFNYNSVILTDAAGVMNSLNNYIVKSEEKFINLANQLPAEVAKEIKMKAEALFTDPEKGPFYVSRLLLSTVGFDVIKSLKAIINSIDFELERMDESIRENERLSMLRFNEARDALFLSKDRKKNDYIMARIREYKAKNYQRKLVQMKQFYSLLIPIVNKYNNDIFFVFTEVLDRLNRVLKENGEILTQSHIEKEGNSTTYYWNIVNIPEVSKAIDQIVNERKAEEMIKDFLNEILKESKSWLEESEINIIESISSFLTDKFGEIISKSMEEFLKMQYGEDMDVKEITGRIAGKLNQKAVPVFYMDNINKSVNFPTWGLVSIPLKSPDIRDGIKDYQKNALGNTNFTIKESKVTNRIFWLNTYNGVPLYTYSPIRQYEEAYEKGLNTPGNTGRHLVQTDKEDWADFPSPIPEDFWGEIYCNERLKKMNAETRKLFDRAIQEKPTIMNYDSSATTLNKYQIVETEDFDIEAFMSKYSINLEDEKNIRYDELKRCINDLAKLLEKGLVRKNTYDIFHSVDEKTAKDNLIRSPRLIRILKNEAAKYDSIKEKLAKLQEVINITKKKEEAFKNFFTVVFTNTICKKGLKYVYDLEEGEKGEWNPFADAMSTLYVEYKIYENYCKLEDKNKRVIEDKSKKRFDRMTYDEKIIGDRITELIHLYKEKIEKLEESMGITLDNDMILEFYKKMMTELLDMKVMAGL